MLNIATTVDIQGNQGVQALERAIAVAWENNFVAIFTLCRCVPFTFKFAKQIFCVMLSSS